MDTLDTQTSYKISKNAFIFKPLHRFQLIPYGDTIIVEEWYKPLLTTITEFYLMGRYLNNLSFDL